MKSILARLIERYRQFILYGIIGCICSGTDFAVYSALVYLSVNMLLANIIGVNTGIILSFYLNRKYNFKVGDRTLRRFFSFYCVGLVGLCVSTALLYGLVTIYGLNEYYSKIFTIFVVAVLQFILNKTITFKETEKAYES